MMMYEHDYLPNKAVKQNDWQRKWKTDYI